MTLTVEQQELLHAFVDCEVSNAEAQIAEELISKSDEAREYADELKRLRALVAKHGWCGHVCPVGASYALIGSKPLLRVAATHSARCDDCGDCYAVCPEPQVIVMPLKGKAGHGPVVSDRECTACGRCIDVCAPDVFRFTHRFDTRRDPT